MKKEINKYFDHTLLRADATEKEIEILCNQAIKSNYAAVCVNPIYVEQAKEILENSDINIATVVGFPLGANLTETKVYEASLAASFGANEIDMVINIGALKMEDSELVYDDIMSVAKAADLHGAIVKVIIETSLLTDEEKVLACHLAEMAGVGYVKTSTGFSKYGATVEDVKILREALSDNVKIKAAGGIKDLKTVLELIEAGADRIGTSSAEAIMEEYNKKKENNKVDN